MESYFRIMDIIRGTTVDGPGFRTSIYLAGCSHACPGCQNPQSWNENNGTLMSLSEIMNVVREEDFNVTLSGGDPLFHPDEIIRLLEALKEDKRNIWLYTGFSWEEIIQDKRLTKVASLADVVVDGRYEENLRDPDLPFKGSSNQRIIDVNKSLAAKKVVLFSPSL